VLLCCIDTDDVDEDYDADPKLRLESVSITPDRKSLPQGFNAVVPSASDSYLSHSTPKFGPAASRSSPMVCILY